MSRVGLQVNKQLRRKQSAVTCLLAEHYLQLSKHFVSNMPNAYFVEWLNESSESDSDDIDLNFVALECDPDSASEKEGSEGEETINEQQKTESNDVNESLYNFGKNQFK
ncbi:hypothetical protein EVAR_11359_1 [Eumeta japonica]|uniref:Uncharacterized protein n=1 Tax=Eumeta variegata TaxID=151549 RepID=A0A4C1U108_EUMVA|nr:hypothetical protein EVAR_11359_1 [Eumeta japonica]